MRLSRYIALLVVILSGIAARGQDFNPSSPGEPNPTYLLKVKADPVEAATVSGGGRYTVNRNVTVSATLSSAEWKLVNWTNSAGEVVSTSNSFTYKTLNTDQTLTAHFEKVETSMLTTKSDPGSLFNETTTEYKVGTSVNVSCGSYSYFSFVNWTDKDGNVVSDSRSFTYVVTDVNQVLTAHYSFTPSSPSEPSETKAKHRVYFSANPSSAGYFNQTNGMQVAEGNSFSVYAYTYSGYSFKNWTINGVVVSTDRTYSATMGTSDVTLVANYLFDPSAPGEPRPDTRNHFSLYGNTISLYKGESVLYPIYLENTATAKSLEFSMILPEGFTCDVEALQTTSRTSAYTATAILDGQTLTIALMGGTQISEKNGPVVLIPLTATNQLEDGTYPLNFSSALLTLSDDTNPTVTFRNGSAEVSTLEEGDIQAQFSVDRYMNRAQFTNQSSSDSRTFVWDFGDGNTSTETNPMHVYAQPGTYTVRLTAKGVLKEDVAEQTLVINAPSSWTASGDYTLDSKGTGVRNFTSVKEMLNLLSQCTPNGDISVAVSNASPFTAAFAEEDELATFSTLASKLSTTGNKMTLASSGTGNASIALTVPAEASALTAAIAWMEQLTLMNVNLALNGAKIYPDQMVFETSQTACSNASTTAIDFTAFGDELITAEWYASVSASCQLAGYQTVGGNTLPAMQISNPGNTTDYIDYHVTVMLNGVEIKSYIYKLYVKPSLAGRTFENTSPADGTTVNFGNQTLRWTNLGSLASAGYTLHITRTYMGEMQEMEPVSTTSSSYTIDALPGASYTWYVEAYGDCDEMLTSQETSFTVRTKSDLQVISVVAPETSKGNTSITVRASIQNTSEVETVATSWNDAIYYSTSPDNFANAQYLTSVRHSGRVAAGGSYETSFTVTTPEATAEHVYYYVKADYSGNEQELNENNNVMQSVVVELFAIDINAEDYAALLNLYHALNGELWNTHWKLNTTAVISSAWLGVTFNDEGRVTAINLSNNSIGGQLDATVFNFPYITSINLSHNNLTGLTGSFPSSVVNVDLSYQRRDFGITSYECQNWTIGSTIAPVDLGSIISYDVASGSYTAHPNLSLYSVASNSYLGSLVYDEDESAYLLKLNGNYTLASGAEVMAQPTSGTAAYCRLRATLDWAMGDANTDGWVDVLDAQHTINYILGTQTGNFNYAAANTYTDNLMNVQDVVATINLFIDNDESNLVKGWMTTGTLNNVIYATGNRIMLQSEEPISALDIRLIGVTASQVSMQLNRNDFQCVMHKTANGVRVVIVSPTGEAIPAGISSLFQTSSEAEIASVKAANAQAQYVGIGIDNPTNISDIPTDSDMKVEGIYNVQGIRLNSINRKGIYLIDGKKVLKK
ncbi:MAG: PKD domain-containing protein [Bacteroidaceae bacterium]|nr:PKD domain-containing protein [Bacteroidaceae bacterium]